MMLDPGLRDILVAILSLSFLVFVALFGHVPALRKTPIGWGHHFMWKTLPRWFTTADMKLTGGMMVRSVKGLFNYVMYEKHPLIQLFYIGLVSGGLYLFYLGAWDRLWSPFHKVMVPIVASLPYITLYLASYTDPGYILPENHRGAMKLYPFDYINFKPGYHCSTCHFEKPARSKHCPICKHCIAKQDHHCVWINNCVGHKNVKYFFAFLMSTNIILFYGFYLTSIMIHQLVVASLPAGTDISKIGWGLYFNQFMLCLVLDVCLGIVCLLCMMTGLMSVGFTGYHFYLLWAGTTTNETFKWSDWKEDIAAEEVWMARDPARNPYTGRWPSAGPLSAYNWPVQTDKIVYRIIKPEEMEYLDKHLVWNRVESIHDLENIYDIGFWRTLEGVIWDLKF
ncbi:palmitoyltransferase swf1 [Arthrobotrys musiformis]|uniref:Palmitoyltransferase n=1 Tax=Arthrobotrys musiformis TaxID=47236 RepID=A0AAV9WIB7_9PEZI